MVKIVKCVICPLGCDVSVTTTDKNEVLSVEGNQCKRGYQYCIDECLCPSRMITTTILVKGAMFPVTSVRTDKPVPKDKIFDCMKEIKNIFIDTPFNIGYIVLENIAQTGANIIVTRSDLGK